MNVKILAMQIDGHDGVFNWISLYSISSLVLEDPSSFSLF